MTPKPKLSHSFAAKARSGHATCGSSQGFLAPKPQLSLINWRFKVSFLPWAMRGQMHLSSPNI